MKICPKCNSQVADDATYCTTCGAQLEAVTPAEAPATNVEAPSIESTPMPEPTINNPAPAKKSDTKTLILAIVAGISLLLAIGAIIFSVVMLNTKNTKTGNTGPDITTTEEGGGNSASASGVKALLGEYEVTIPGKYQYEMQDDDSLLLADEDGKEWVIALQYHDDITFTLISNNIENFAANLKAEKGFVEATAGEEKVGKEKVPYVDVSDGTEKATFAFFESDDLHVFSAFLIDASGEYNHDLMKNAQKVLKTAKKKQASKSFNGKSNILKKYDDIDDSDLK